MTTLPVEAPSSISEKTYRGRVFAWTMYDWANSAFATTILAAVLPVYFSLVAGATLPSEAQATAYWSIALAVSLLIGAVLSPVLGTISDVSRSKKRLLGLFTGIGVIGTGLLILVQRGDWALAMLLFIVARVGFLGSYSFYDSLLPHVARPNDQDRVSARGYAMGYLGGGILLAINIVMILFLPGTWGARLSFLSVAVWWAVFSIPIFRRVPEPDTAGVLRKGQSVVSASLATLSGTFRDIRRYRELFKYLVAFLIYNDAIGTIIGLAVIYGAELGFGSVELILALLLVQFVGIPFSLMFGSLPSAVAKRRDFYLAFVIFNLVALPVVAIASVRMLPASLTGTEPAPYAAVNGAVGQGKYAADDPAVTASGAWAPELVAAQAAGVAADTTYLTTMTPGDQLALTYNGATVELVYATSPDGGLAEVLLDGSPLIDPETGEPLIVDFSNDSTRYGERLPLPVTDAGQHTLTLVAAAGAEGGQQVSVAGLNVLPPPRGSSLLAILGLLLAVQGVGLVFALLARRLFRGLANTLDTRRSIVLSLIVYSVVAVWGFFLSSTIEFWFIAWMIAIVQGGSQALSRSLYASMSPAKKSGEFFGLYGVMEKFSSILGPLVFAAAVAIFGSSRPAIISLIVFFIVGGYLLMRVNVQEGQRVAREEDAISERPQEVLT